MISFKNALIRRYHRYVQCTDLFWLESLVLKVPLYLSNDSWIVIDFGSRGCFVEYPLDGYILHIKKNVCIVSDIYACFHYFIHVF